MKPFPTRVVHIAAAAVAAYYAIWAGEYSSFDLLRIADQRRTEEVRLAATRLEADSLRAVADRLENDNRAIETLAREHFGMVRDGEILYRFVEVSGPETSGTAVARP